MYSFPLRLAVLERVQYIGSVRFRAVHYRVIYPTENRYIRDIFRITALVLRIDTSDLIRTEFSYPEDHNWSIQEALAYTNAITKALITLSP